MLAAALQKNLTFFSRCRLRCEDMTISCVRVLLAAFLSLDLDLREPPVLLNASSQAASVLETSIGPSAAFTLKRMTSYLVAVAATDVHAVAVRGRSSILCGLLLLPSNKSASSKPA
jgi:hypothetical protein